MEVLRFTSFIRSSIPSVSDKNEEKSQHKITYVTIEIIECRESDPRSAPVIATEVVEVAQVLVTTDSKELETQSHKT